MDDYDFASSGGRYFYSRTANPNRDGLSQAISYLEQGDATIICSSGMAAIATVLLGLLESGSHILMSQRIYGETIELANTLLKKSVIRLLLGPLFSMADTAQYKNNGNACPKAK